MSKGLSRVFSNTTVQKHQFFGAQLFFIVQLSHPYLTTGKTIALTRQTFVGKVVSLLLNMLSRLVITFLPRSKRLLISCLQSSERGLRQGTERGREELPHVRGQGQKLGGPHVEGWQPRGVTPRPRSGAVATSVRLRQHRSSREELPLLEARGGGWEEQPHVQGAVAAREEGLEELSHVEGQEGQQ